MDFSDFAGEDPKVIMGEILDVAEAMVQPLLDKAHVEATSSEDLRMRVTKITLALCIGLAVIGERYYKQKAGSEMFGEMVAQVVRDGMEKMIDIMSEERKGDDDDTTAETEGSAWSRRRA